MISPPPESTTLRFHLEPEAEPKNLNSAPDSGTNPSGDRFEAEAAKVPDAIFEAGAEHDDKQGGAPDSGQQGWPEQLVAGVFELPTAFLAGRLGGYWRLSENELKMLVAAAKPMLDEYIPFDMLGKCGALLVVSTVVFGPRLAQMELDQQAEKTRNSQTATSAA